jgi:hypothetical protein
MILIESFYQIPHLFKTWTYNSPLLLSRETSDVEYSQSIRGFPKDIEQKLDQRVEYLTKHLEKAQSAIANRSRKLWVTDASSRDDPGDSDLDMKTTSKV